MEVHQGIDRLPLASGPSAVTVGFFDGVHVGHRALLEETVAAAHAHGWASVAVTFDRHPREVLTPGREPRLLTTTGRKASLIADTGIDHLLVMEFTEEFAGMTAEDFVNSVLMDGLDARHIVVGSNFTFGHRALGTVETLRDIGEGLRVEALGLVELDGRPVSSSSVRAALSEGDLVWPELALGRRYSVDGDVVSGHGRGHGLGYPTANLETSPRLLLPGQGIYAGRARVEGEWHIAAIDVGTNPTFGVDPLHVESFLLDFDGDIWGKPMSVEFWARLRDEERFDSTEALVEQMDRDVALTRDLVREG